MKTPLMKLAIALLILAACNGNGNSPTQPTVPDGTLARSWSIVLISPEGDGAGANFPKTVEVTLDAAVIYTGPPTLEWDDNFERHTAFAHGRFDGLASGHHAIRLKILEKEQGREPFSLSAAVRAQEGFALAWWADSVTLGVGDSWTGEFETR